MSSEQSGDVFHAIHVVSDLHLGGEAGFQIFDQGEVLAGFIDSIAQRPASGPVALVLNGDVVDFLAEKDARYLDPEGAAGKLSRITEDPAFAEVWKALKRYTHTVGRHLVVSMGNHDVELALPSVRARLLEALCGDNLEARARVSLVMDGTGWSARVGKARVLCVHGNEVDTWNVVDHEALRRLIQALQAHMPLPAWTPNAGTKLVIDLMNDVKKRHPLVDLLKPEASQVPAVLLALEPSLLKQLEQVLPVVGRLASTALRRSMGLLSAFQPHPMQQVSWQGGPLSSAATLSAEQLLEQSQLALDSGLTALDLVSPPEAQQPLGRMALVRDLVLAREPQESLREALADWLHADTSFPFHHGSTDETFAQLDAQVGEDIDFLIAGHTHLERALPRTRGDGYYFNTGTWARLIQLTPDMLNNAAKFERVYAAFQEGTMKALDDYPGLVVRRPTVVSITEEAGQIRGSLGHAGLKDGQPTLEPCKDFTVKR